MNMKMYKNNDLVREYEQQSTTADLCSEKKNVS